MLSDLGDYYVYAHTKPDGTVFYIGKGHKKRAWSAHNRNRYWKSIVAKHGYEVVILAEGFAQKAAIEEEALLIAHFRRFGFLANILDRGDIAPSSNPEVAARIGRALRGIKRSEETKQKMRERVFSAATRQKLSEAAQVRVVSDETRRRISDAGRGRTHSQQTRQKMRQAAMVRGTAALHSEAAKQAANAAHPWRGVKRPELSAMLKTRGVFAGDKNPFYGKGCRQVGELNHMATTVNGLHCFYGATQWATATAAAKDLGVSLQAVVQAVARKGRSKGWRLEYTT
jgi:hypothetical protein